MREEGRRYKHTSIDYITSHFPLSHLPFTTTTGLSQMELSSIHINNIHILSANLLDSLGRRGWPAAGAAKQSQREVSLGLSMASQTGLWPWLCLNNGGYLRDQIQRWGRQGRCRIWLKTKTRLDQFDRLPKTAALNARKALSLSLFSHTYIYIQVRSFIKNKKLHASYRLFEEYSFSSSLGGMIE